MRPVRFPWLLLACSLTLACLLPGRAFATEAPASALFAEAEEAEAALDFAKAARLYRELLAKAPSHFKAQRARARAEDLEAHAEGDFVPLTKLETLRRDPALSSDPERLAALEREADSFPEGKVRGEARLFVGGAFLGRLDRPAQALAPFEKVVRDERADGLQRRLALGQLVEVHRKLGDREGAVRAVDEYPELLPDLREVVHREARRVWIRGGAILLLLFVSGMGAWGAARIARGTGLRQALRLVLNPFGAMVAVWMAVAGAALARSYDASDPTPFLLLGAGVALLQPASKAWALGFARERPALLPRLVRAGLCMAAVAAVAFLALEASDIRYLDSFGL